MKRWSVWIALVASLITALVVSSGSALASSTGSALNDWSCRPTATHPYPVVLIEGTAGRSADWTPLATQLDAQGYCTYALDYGTNFFTFYQVNAMGPVAQSARQVSAFIHQVLSSTGATKVDLVAHSQGGMIAEYYAKNMHQSSTVHSEVLMAPVTHGTTLNGLVTYADYSILLRPLADIVMMATICPACVDMEQGSLFVRSLNNGSIAQAGVTYSVLATTQDTTVTPAGTASFIDEPGVENNFIQDFCPKSTAPHATMPQDADSIQWVANALAGNPEQPIRCAESS